MANYSREVTASLSKLIAQQPLFAVYLMNQMDLVECHATATASTDGKTIRINPNWWADMTLDEQVFVLCHEVMHGMFRHTERGELYRARGYGPDGKPYNHKLANDAMDYIINDMLKKAKIGTMPVKGGLWSDKYTADMLMDDVYIDLNATANDDDPPSEGKGNQGDEGDDRDSGFDEHLPPPAGADLDNEQQHKTALAQAVQAAESMGKLPASLKKLMGVLMEPELTWEELLRNAIASRIGNDGATWKRPNRRRISVAPHIYFPGTEAHDVGGIVIAIDISGSTMTLLPKFFAEAAGILAEIKAEWIKVVCVNSSVDVEQVWDIDDPDDLNEIEITCGGSTDLESLAPWLDDEQIDADHVIWFTDSLTRYSPDNPFNCAVTWCLSKEHRTPTYGNIIVMK